MDISHILISVAIRMVIRTLQPFTEGYKKLYCNCFTINMNLSIKLEVTDGQKILEAMKITVARVRKSIQQ